MFTGTIPIELSPPTYYSNTTTAPSYSYMLRHVHLQGNGFEGSTIDDVFCNNNVSALSTNSSDQSSYYPYYYYSLVADCSLREEVFCSCCTECCSSDRDDENSTRLHPNTTFVNATTANMTNATSPSSNTNASISDSGSARDGLSFCRAKRQPGCYNIQGRLIPNCTCYESCYSCGYYDYPVEADYHSSSSNSNTTESSPSSPLLSFTTTDNGIRSSTATTSCITCKDGFQLEIMNELHKSGTCS